jgi:hypothetical protein
MTTDTTSAIAAWQPTSPADDAGIRATIDDYYLGWYDGDGERMARALHPDLAKRGWFRYPDEPILDPDTFATMTALAAAGRGRRDDPQGRRYEIEIADVHADIATAVVHAVPYVDYLHLVRTVDGWRILNALWTPPAGVLHPKPAA